MDEIYLQTEPDVGALRKSYETTINDLDYYFQQCRRSSDDRRCFWTGKTWDLQKHGSDAFPWDGASDLEAPVIQEHVQTYVSMFMTALSRSNIRAYPVEPSDTARGKLVSGFLKWMVHSYIKGFMPEMERAANYFLDKGLMVTYVGWTRQMQSYLQSLDLEVLAQVAPELAEAVVNGNQDDMIIDLFRQQFPDLLDGRAKKALKQLRTKGRAELPVSRKSVDAPYIKTLATDADVFFPSYSTDPHTADMVFYRVFMTPQELLGKVATDGWDEKWVDYAIEHLRGMSFHKIDSMYEGRSSTVTGRYIKEDTNLVEIVYAYQKLVDKMDGSEGIYCTVFAPAGCDPQGEEYAKFELLNGYDSYPFVVTRLSEDQKRLYDVQTFADHLRGFQTAIKTERDQRVDKSSMATLPPLLHPVGRRPSDWGPGRMVPYHRPNDFQYGPTPPFDSTSIEVERTLTAAAKDIVGLNGENPFGSFRQQFLIGKFLGHVRDVLKLAYKCFQRFGPDEVFFRVTGVADPMTFNKGNPDEDFDIIVNFDSQQNDPENMERWSQQFIQLLSLDRNGRINVDSLIEMMAASVNPVMADMILQPVEVASQQVVKQVLEDLTMIYSGIEVGARPQGAQIALQTIQQYTQQPDVAQRLQQDEAFKGRLEKYYAQYMFQMQQAQNAQTGRVGTAPAQFQGQNQ
jgi:hypothetical protein